MIIFKIIIEMNYSSSEKLHNCRQDRQKTRDNKQIALSNDIYVHVSITIYDFRLQLIITAILPIKVLFSYKSFQQDKIIYIFNMIKNIALLVCTLALIGSYFVLRDNNEEIDFKGTEYFGNMSDVMKQSVRDAIQLSAYKYQDLNDMSQFIGDRLDNLHGYSWQVFIFSHGCDMIAHSSTNKYLDRWARFQNYGNQDFCYYIFQTKVCKGTSPSVSLSQPNGQMWGSSFNSTQRERVLALVQEASIRSSDPGTNAVYIRQRLGTVGAWAATLGHPKNNQFGYYACVYKEYWALLWDKGAYNWCYIINKYQ